jgi:hypothetical protein
VIAPLGRNQVQKGVSNMLDMIDRWSIDVEESLVGALLLKTEQKMQRSKKDDPNSPMVPAHDKENVPKWTVHLSLEARSFESTKFANIQVTVTSPKQPCEGMPQGTPVIVQGLELGLMPRGNSGNGGFSVFFLAEAIIPRQSAQPGQPPRQSSTQPQQPARAASGQ